MEKAFHILKLLSDPTRHKIIRLLLGYDYCVGAIAKRLHISESAASQHLKTLRKAGIVKGDKRGYFTHYVIDRKLLKQAADYLMRLSEVKKDFRCSKSAKDLCIKEKEEKMATDQCQHPELKPRKGKCSKQQIRQCHGDEQNHPCDTDQKDQ